MGILVVFKDKSVLKSTVVLVLKNAVVVLKRVHSIIKDHISMQFRFFFEMSKNLRS